MKKEIKNDLLQIIRRLATDYANLNEPNIDKATHELQQNRIEISWHKFYEAYSKGAEGIMEFILNNYELKKNVPSNYCQCEKPNRQLGFTYCDRCHKHVSDTRMRFLVTENEMSKIPATDDTFKEKANIDYYYHCLCARATLFPGKSIEEAKELILKRMREDGYMGIDINTKIYKKIDEAYENINDELCNKMVFNDKITREFIIKKIKEYVGADCELTIKCNEENNPSDIIDMNLLIADIGWEHNFTSYRKRLVFGNDNNIRAYYYTRFC